MEEVFDDLICLDEEGDSLESSTSENLSKTKQQTRNSRRQSESDANHHKNHGDILQRHFLDRKQMSSRYYFEKTFDITRSDFGSARCSRTERMKNADELTTDTSLLEVDSCEGDDSDYLESGRNPHLNQSSGNGESRVSDNDESLRSSLTLPIYGDDEDWPYLSGDVDEEAVRLAASMNPDAIDEAKGGTEEDQRKKRDGAEKFGGKRISQHHSNNSGSSHHSKTPDKLDGLRRLRKFSPFTTSSRERRSVVYAYQEARHHYAMGSDLRYRRQEPMKYHELASDRHGRLERISLFMSSQNRRNSLQTNTGPSLLYSKKTYLPYPSPCRREDSGANVPKRSSGVSGVVVKRSYQLKTQSSNNSSKEGRNMSSENTVQRKGLDKVNQGTVRRKPTTFPPTRNNVPAKTGDEKNLAEDKYAKVEVLNDIEFTKERTEHEETPKKKMRWILTTKQVPTGGVATNSVVLKDHSDQETVTKRRVTPNHDQDIPKGNPIKLRLPNFPVL